MTPPRRWLEDGGIDPEMKRDLALMGDDHVDDGELARAAAVFAAALAAGTFAATSGTAAAAATAAPAASWVAKLGAAKGWLLAAGVTAAGGGVVGGVVVSHRQQAAATAKARRPAPAVHVAARPKIEPLPPVVAEPEPEPVVAETPVEAPPVAPRPRKVAPRPAVRAVRAPVPVAPVVAPVRVNHTSSLTAETGLVAEIIAAYESDPVRALDLVKRSRAQFPDGQLGQERDAYGIFSLDKVGRRDEARSAGRVFLARYRNGPYSAKVRAIVDGSPVPK